VSGHYDQSRVAATDDDLTARLTGAAQALEEMRFVQARPGAEGGEAWETQVAAAAAHTLASVEALTPAVATRVHRSEWDAADRLFAHVLVTQVRHALSNLRAVTCGMASRVENVRQLTRQAERFVANDAQFKRRRAQRLAQRQGILMNGDSNG
jgi:hypothetical protein